MIGRRGKNYSVGDYLPKKYTPKNYLPGYDILKNVFPSDILSIFLQYLTKLNISFDWDGEITEVSVEINEKKEGTEYKYSPYRISSIRSNWKYGREINTLEEYEDIKKYEQKKNIGGKYFYSCEYKNGEKNGKEVEDAYEYDPEDIGYISINWKNGKKHGKFIHKYDNMMCTKYNELEMITIIEEIDYKNGVIDGAKMMKMQGKIVSYKIYVNGEYSTIRSLPYFFYYMFF
jgi:hypothetical protein